MTPDDPVMAGHLVDRYLGHLRCPNGAKVSWRRRGSTVVHDLSFVKRRKGMADPGALIPARDDRVNVDIYTVKCECGHHEIEEVFVDSYHVAFDRCINAKDWTFVGAFPDGRTLQAGQVTDG